MSQKEAYAKWYAKPENRASHIAKSRQNKDNQRLRNKLFVAEYLGEHPCVDCEFSDIRALQFDHILGIKDKEVSVMVQGGYSISRILVEIAKCEVRCANCHSIVTAERRQNMGL